MTVPHVNTLKVTYKGSRFNTNLSLAQKLSMAKSVRECILDAQEKAEEEIKGKKQDVVSSEADKENKDKGLLEGTGGDTEVSLDFLHATQILIQ